MQRHHSDLGSHARGSFDGRVVQDTPGTTVARSAKSPRGAAQRRLTRHSISHPASGGDTTPTSLGWWVMTQPAAVLGLRGVEHFAPAATDAAPAGPIGGMLKRSFDIGVASLALVLLSPLLLMAALLIKLTMGGPVLLAHSRVGLNGKVFRCYKFPTMATDADDRLRRYLSGDLRMAHPSPQTCGLAGHPHAVALGQILRKAGIDELPQLINVLRGDMSCVGPRPVIASELQRYGAQVADYLKARPGLTGLWQVSGGNSLSCANRIELDGLYVRNWSMFLDLAILVRTIPAVSKINQTV